METRRGRGSLGRQSEALAARDRIHSRMPEGMPDSCTGARKRAFLNVPYELLDFLRRKHGLNDRCAILSEQSLPALLRCARHSGLVISIK
jgi:hypothetical protein